MGLGAGLPLILAITLYGCMRGVFGFEVTRLALYLLMISWACAAQLFDKPFSVASLCLLVGVFFPYTLRLRGNGSSVAASLDGKALDSQDFFANLGYVAALLGCAQIVVQQLAGPSIAFPIEHVLPKGLIIERFNYLNPIHYGSSIYKANGVFFLEPSFFSQFLAISLLVELSGRQRMHRVVAHLFGLACAFSGTGLIVLGCGVTALILARRQKALIGVGLIVVLIAAAFGDALRLNIFIDRVSEFSNVGTSAFERFIAWTYMLQDQFWNNTLSVWTGFGAGTFYEQQQVARYSVMESPFSKLIFEFGIPGAAFYFAFLLYCVVASGASCPIKVGLLACIMMNGAYSESNTGILLTLLLWPAAGSRFQTAARLVGSGSSHARSGEVAR